MESTVAEWANVQCPSNYDIKKKKNAYLHEIDSPHCARFLHFKRQKQTHKCTTRSAAHKTECEIFQK